MWRRRPVTTLPITPNALLAVEDDDGALVSLTVMTLLPDGTGGSIVAVPVNADATAAFGTSGGRSTSCTRRADLDGFTEAVQEMLSITIERSEAVTAADLAALVPGADGADWRRSPPRPPSATSTTSEPDTSDPDTTNGNDRPRHRPIPTRPTRTRRVPTPPTRTRPIRTRPNQTPVIRMPTSQSPPRSTWGQ